MSDESGGWLEDAVESGENAVREFAEFLGIQHEGHVCPDCNVACVESSTHDPLRMAFDGGESPTWKCPECGTHYRREGREDRHTLDLYGRD